MWFSESRPPRCSPTVSLRCSYRTGPLADPHCVSLCRTPPASAPIPTCLVPMELGVLGGGCNTGFLSGHRRAGGEGGRQVRGRLPLRRPVLGSRRLAHRLSLGLAGTLREQEDRKSVV